MKCKWINIIKVMMSNYKHKCLPLHQRLKVSNNICISIKSQTPLNIFCTLKYKYMGKISSVVKTSFKSIFLSCLAYEVIWRLTSSSTTNWSFFWSSYKKNKKIKDKSTCQKSPKTRVINTTSNAIKVHHNLKHVAYEVTK